MQRNHCVTRNNIMWTDFLYEEDAKELAATQQEADRADHVWEVEK